MCKINTDGNGRYTVKKYENVRWTWCFLITFGLITFIYSPVASQSSPRQHRNFSGLWKFYRGNASGAQEPSFSDDAWETVCLPHTVRVESAQRHTNYDYYQGYCWYRKSFVPDNSFKGKKVYLEVEAAMQSTNVYLNGEKIYSYLGGYNPFIMDITDKLTYDTENICAMQLDNRVNGDVSPGNPKPDFYYYGGLYRYVNLHVTDKMHITNPLFANKVAGGGVFVTYPSVKTSSADVQVKTHIINEYADSRLCKLVTTLLDSDSTEVSMTESSAPMGAGKDTTFTQKLTVTNPRLWHPDSPNRYFVRSQVFDGERLADAMITTIGIRTLSYSRNGGCSINGKRFSSRGANRHQDYGAIGNAVPVSGHYRDALRLKEGGFNFVRLSHYLQHPSFLDACDKLGIAVQASLIGWQHNGFSNQKFVDNSLRDLRTMIRYYRNHPSIIMWESIHNESNPPKSFAQAAHSVAHEEYPGNQMFTVGQETNNVMDIYQAAVQQGGREYSTGKPAAISEYAHWEEGGFESTSNRTRADGEFGLLEQAENHAWGTNENHKLAWLSVDALWVYNDYFGMAQYARSLCSGGTVDVFRIPKFSYYFFQSQRDPSIVIPGVNSGPSVFIASHWTASSALSVWVFSNCEKVSLYLNNTLIETRSPDSNYGNIRKSTFTFKVPSFKAGTLRADGLIGGEAVVSHTVKTPVQAAKVAVAIDTAGLQLQADGADCALVYASIVDTNNTVMPAATDKILFSVSGPGTIISGDGNPVSAVGGIAAVYVQTKHNEPGLITITAKSENYREGSATVTSSPPSAWITGIHSSQFIKNKKQLQRLAIDRYGPKLLLTIPHHEAKPFSRGCFYLYTLRGCLVQKWQIGTSGKIVIHLGTYADGVYYGKLQSGEKTYHTKIPTLGLATK